MCLCCYVSVHSRLCTSVTQPASYQQLHIPPNSFHAVHSTKPQQQECVSKCFCWTDLSTMECVTLPSPSKLYHHRKVPLSHPDQPLKPHDLFLAWGTLKIFCQHFYIMLWLLSERLQLKTFFKTSAKVLNCCSEPSFQRSHHDSVSTWSHLYAACWSVCDQGQNFDARHWSVPSEAYDRLIYSCSKVKFLHVLDPLLFTV